MSKRKQSNLDHFLVKKSKPVVSANEVLATRVEAEKANVSARAAETIEETAETSGGVTTTSSMPAGDMPPKEACSSIGNGDNNQVGYILNRDIGLLMHQNISLSDYEKLGILTSVHQLPILDTKKQDRRNFLKTWLGDDRFKFWLIYTQVGGGGGLCKVCSVMKPKIQYGKLGSFVTSPCIDYKKFLHLALNHNKIEHHNEAVKDAKMFIESMQSGANISTHIQSSNLKQVE